MKLREYFSKMCVRDAVEQIWKEGGYPSLRAVQERLPASISLRDSENAEERREKMKRLGHSV